MVAIETAHDSMIEGVDLQGRTYGGPALLQMNHEDFPKRFLDDLAKMKHPELQLSSVKRLLGDFKNPAMVFQPVQRILHVAAVQLACDSLLQPRLDPLRVESAGLVIRRLRRSADGRSSDPNRPYQAWMKTATGKFQWQTLAPSEACADPDPSRRPSLTSGQPWLDSQLAAATLAHAAAEVYTPAFLAPPATNDTLGRTIAYAVIPAASSEISDAKQGVPAYDSQTLIGLLPNLLSATAVTAAPAPGASVDFRWLSDEYAATQPNNTAFTVFSSSLMMLFRQFNAFDGSPESQAILKIYDRRGVKFKDSDTTQPKGQFFTSAYQKLIESDPNPLSPQKLVMPDSWEPLTQQDQEDLLPLLKAVLAKLSSTAHPPEGRYQDPNRLYVAQLFFRVKGHTPACPSVIHWSEPTAVFRIAAWYDSTQRSTAPIPLPDPTQRGFLKGAKPNVSFAVPDGLMAAMQGASLKDLSNGKGGAGKKLGLNWICGFNIPLITICAFFVLNIFLILLNIVFFWLPFIKICIPIPVVEPPPGDA